MKTLEQFLSEGASSDTHDLSPEQLEDHNKHRETFEPHHFDALHAYKSASTNFNQYLRSTEDYKKYYGNPDPEKYKAMDHVTGHPMKHDYTLYRGFQLHSHELSKLKPGDRFKDNGYVGTTTSKRIAKDFAHPITHITGDSGEDKPIYHYTQIHAPAGTKGYYLDGHNNSYDFENELTLHRGTEFEVTHHTDHEEVLNHVGPDPQKVRVTHLRVVGQEPEELK